METKRLILAIALSMVVIIGYQMLFPPQVANKNITNVNTQENINGNQLQTNDNRQVPVNPIAKKKEETVLNNKTETVKTAETKVAETIKLIKIDSENFTAEFTNKGAALKSFVLKKYMDDNKPEKNNLDLVSKQARTENEVLPFHFSTFDDRDVNNNIYKDANSTLYQVEKIENDNNTKLIFKYTKGATQVSKTFVIYEHSYVIGIDTEIITNGKKIPAPYIFGPELGNNLRPESMMYTLKGFNGTDVEDATFQSMKPGYMPFGKANGYRFHWGAFDTTYFSVIFKFNQSDRDARIMSYVDELIDREGKKTRKNYLIATNPTKVFMGPKEERILANTAEQFNFTEINQVINYGFSWFAPIAKIMLKGINFIYEKILNFGNYGWAIVIFTIFLKLLLFPLTYKSSVSMAKMQTIQPKMKALKKKYKNQKDPAQRKAMNEELMALYKTEKVNPAGGCLPMLLQMPILFAFFMLLRNAINVRHEEWILWIKDLSQLDPYYVLPILMGLTQIILAKMSPSGGDANQKKMMTYMMPIVITFVVMNLASGLTLYWFVSNLLQLGQQHYINKKIYQQKKDTDKEMKAAKKKKGVKRI